MSFEAIECATAEAAELIIASTGTELQALITDHNLAGAMSVARASSVCRPPIPACEHCCRVRHDCEAYAGQYDVLPN